MKCDDDDKSFMQPSVKLKQQRGRKIEIKNERVLYYYYYYIKIIRVSTNK